MSREIPFGRPKIGEAERQAVAEVLSGTTLTHGPKVREFEQSFAAFTGASKKVSTKCSASSTTPIERGRTAMTCGFGSWMPKQNTTFFAARIPSATSPLGSDWVWA